MSNPLLGQHVLPPFSKIEPDQVEPAISRILSDNRAAIGALVDRLQAPNWQELVEPLDELNDRLDQAWSPVGHLNSVLNSDKLREAYNAALPLVSEYYSELGQSEPLYNAFRALADSDESRQLDAVQQKVISNSLRDFKLAGISLDADKKQRFRDIRKQLSELTSTFSENVLDATQGWTRLVASQEELAGVPESTLAALRQAAQAKDMAGYLVTLEFPSYFPIITYCESAELREAVYEAFVTRASDCGPNAGSWDNSELISQILELRQELAALLDFNSYAEYSLATKMAETPAQVLEFLADLAARARPKAQQEFAELRAFARERYGVDDLRPWDISFYSERLRQEKYAVSQEELRPYFPADHVISGMFEVVNRLYAIDIQPVEDVDGWHPDVRFYEVHRAGTLIGRFYLDLYARENKRGGAWMDECRVRRALPDGSVQLPVAYLTCNFSGPVGETPALLTHNEVTTLFHEFGHGLHHLLTRVNYAGVSGIRGVAWDAVELPSQFMENWCWEKQGLALISRHYETGETLPEALLGKMLAARNFQAAMQLMRQLEFSLFDMRIHMEHAGDQPLSVQEVLDAVRSEVAVVPVAPYNRFQHGFSHIFAGGYAAGYYSYKWAEVLSADAFSRFEEEGIFSAETGRSFLESILEKGGSEEPLQLFTAFRGREPQIDALLRHTGLVS